MIHGTTGLLLSALLLCGSAAPKAISAQRPAPSLTIELDSLVVILARGDRRLGAGLTSVEADRARLRVGLSREPLILETEIENIPPGTSPLDAEQAKATLSTTLYRGGRTGAVRAQRTAALAQSQIGVELVRAAIQAEYRQEIVSWLVWRGIEERFNAQDSVLALAADLLTARFAAGTTRYLDVLRLRTERLQLARERARASTEATAHRAGLERRVGTDPAVTARLREQLARWEQRQAWTEVPSTIGPTRGPRPDSLVDRAVQAQFIAIDANAAVARAERGVTLGGTLGLQRFLDGAGFTTGPTFGVSIGLPFSLTGAYGRERAAIRLGQAADSAKLVADLVEWNATTTRLDLIRDGARDRARLFDNALLAGAAEEREAAFAGFRTGSVSLLELLDFERAIAEVERDRLLTMLEIVTADAAIAERALAAFAPSSAMTSEDDLP